jgi:hypothetical protein
MPSSTPLRPAVTWSRRQASLLPALVVIADVARAAPAAEAPWRPTDGWAVVPVKRETGAIESVALSADGRRLLRSAGRRGDDVSIL